MNYSDLLSQLKSSSLQNPSQIQVALQSFIQNNEDPRKSANFRSKGRDNMSDISQIMILHSKHPHIILSALKVIKILSRKQENRKKIESSLVELIANSLETYLQDTLIAREGANAILNICYEKENVKHVIKSGCIETVLSYIKDSKDGKLLAACAGAIQSVCFQKEGKQCVKQLKGATPMIGLLSNSETTVRSRAVGALHNLSSDIMIVAQLRENGAIPVLLELLKDTNMTIVSSAAGCLQNISREDESRVIIQDNGGVPLLTELLFMDQLPAQTCAAGALLNILGPDLGPESADNPQRRALKKILSLSLFFGQISDITEDLQKLELN